MSSSKSNEKAAFKASESSEESPKDLETLFVLYAKFGERESDGSTITLKNIDKWLKQAKILGSRKYGILNADTAITFAKIMQSQKRMDFEAFNEFIETLAADKNVERNDLMELLIIAGKPGLSNITSPVSSGRVGANLKRMTDTTLYTGAHKARFDDEGKGKGIEGRVDRQSSSGYVTGFKNKESYEKLHDQNKKSSKESKINVKKSDEKKSDQKKST